MLTREITSPQRTNRSNGEVLQEQESNGTSIAAPPLQLSADGPPDSNSDGDNDNIQGSVGQGGDNNSDDVTWVQTQLNKHGAALSVDGIMGPKTIEAITNFQNSKLGWSDGVVDVAGKTFSALGQIPVLGGSVGDGGNNDIEEVIKIQRLLNKHGAKILEDGKIGPQTINAIKNYQQTLFGWSDGVIDPGGKTWNSLHDSNFDAGGKTGGQNEDSHDHGGSKDNPTGEVAPGDLIYSDKVSGEFVEKVKAICADLGIQPDYLMAAMAFETGGSFDPAQKNLAGSSGTGLIQFMSFTAKNLGTTTAELAKMSAVEQLDYVKKYFQPYAGRLKTLEDLYMAILWPRAIGKSNDYVLWSKGTKAYTQNSGLDTNKDGKVTKGEAAGKVKERYDIGVDARNARGGAGNSDTGGNQGGDTADPTNDNTQDNQDQTDTGNNTSNGQVPGTSNFSIEEFHSNDGVPVPEEYYGNVRELMQNLEVIRAELDGNSITVNSGYRSPAHNRSVRGKSRSKHLIAQAADIVVSGYTPAQVHAKIAALIEAGKVKQGGLGKYNTFTHYDIRGTRARW